jgi:polysaccharide export outer membrane protein
MTIWNVAAFAALSCALASCASGPLGADPSVAVATLETLPPPATSDYAMPPGVALIRPLDKLKIEVLGLEELERELSVDSDGRIDFPLIGSVEANGLTAGELAAAIEDGLRGPYVRDPQVTVAVLETPGQLITVGGEVTEPGRYPAIGSMTLLDAVAAGGGASPTAKLSEVIVQRMVDGHRYIGIYDMKAIARGNYADPQVYPGDVVMVGDSPARRLLSAIVSASPLLTSAVILFDRTSN